MIQTLKKLRYNLSYRPIFFLIDADIERNKPLIVRDTTYSIKEALERKGNENVKYVMVGFVLPARKPRKDAE